MMRQAQNRENAEDAVQEDISLMRSINRDQKVLGSFYQHLLAPVEAHLQGATEVLIIPHKELFDVPWAALFDNKTGQYLTNGTCFAWHLRCAWHEGRCTRCGSSKARSTGGTRWWWATLCQLVVFLCPRPK